jgi:flagellar basal-body rod protein FlgF
VPVGTRLALTAVAMDNLTAIAASGMRARVQALDLLANNLANTSSGGFKADREMFSLPISGEEDTTGSADSELASAQDGWTDFSQGVLEVTGNPLDIALSGKGLLAVKSTDGQILYTRNGSLHMSPKGVLLAAEERPVLDAQGNPIQLNPNRPVEFDRAGHALQEGATVAQLGIYEFPSTRSLVKVGNTYFRNVDPANVPNQSLQTTVYQGKAESSNVNSADAAVRLVGMMRQFDMLQKAISVGTEMDRHSTDELGKVNT